MAQFRVTVPDGSAYNITAPDDATQDQIMQVFHSHIGQNEPPKQPEKPHLDQSYLAGLARTALGQGTAFGLGDEIAAGARSLIGGENYDEALNDERAKVKQFEEENPIASTVGELGGSLVTPGLGLALGSIKPAANIAGKIAQGAKIGGVLGGAYGAASSEGGDGDIISQIGHRLEGAKEGAISGAVLGGAVPAAGSIAGGLINKAKDAVAPVASRLTGGGVEGAADQVMLARLRAAGDDPAALRDQLEAADRAGTFYGGGKSASVTDSPLGLVDLTPSMQKLGGSAARASEEANTRANAFLNTRQTGVTPRSQAEQDAIADAAVPNRNPFAPLEKDAEPAGQYERVKDALTRAMTLQDKDFHNFGPNAYRTEQAMMDALKTKSDQLYGDARTASQNFNVQPVIAPIIKKIANDAASAPVGEATLIRKALRQFTTGDGNVVTSLDAFDKAKRAVDGLVGRARTAGDKNAERVLTGVKNDLISAVDSVPDQDIGAKYKAARNYFSSQMDMKDAIDLGRSALRENSDVVSDQFKSLTEGQKKLFRLGLIESFEANMGRGKRTNDITQPFETPRVQDLLREVIPRPTTPTGRIKAGAEYADRPERFGDFLANEKAMVKSGNKVLGGSQTQANAMSDAKFSRQGLGQMVEGLKGSGLTGVALEAASATLNKVFGLREDVAAEIGRRLFTADPAQRDLILTRLEQKYGSQKMPKLFSALSKVSLVGASAGAGQVGRNSADVQPSLKGGIGPNYDDFGNLRTP